MRIGGQTGIRVVIVISIRADLSALEVLVLDLGKSNHCGKLSCNEDRGA